MNLGSLKDGILSAFGFGKAGTAVFYPYNSLLTDYGIGENSQVFSVRLIAYAHADTKVGSKVDQVPNTKIAEFEIIQSTPSVTLSHSHSYGGDSFIHQLANGVNGATFLGLNFSTIAEMVNGTMIQVGGGSAAVSTPWNTFGGLDLAKSYTGSQAPSFKVEFNLVTHNNALTDVVIPSILLSYLSYPKVDNKRGINEMIKILAKQSNSILQAATKFIGGLGDSGAEKTAKEGVDKALDGLKTLRDSIKNLSAGKWRYTVGQAPPYWTLRCSNGIYGMMNASLADVTITYNGPWLDATKASLGSTLGGLLQVASGSMTGLNPQSILGEDTGGFDVKSLTDFFGGGVNQFKGYPTSATVSLTFVSNYSKVFGEEIIASMEGHTGAKVGVNLI
jgi:hypothetical protein